MEVYIRKYFWILGVVVVVVCSVLAAQAANNLVEAKYLGDAVATAPTSRRGAAKKVDKSKRSKTGEPIAKRNMFCNDCLPPEPDPADIAAGEGDGVPLTSLPLQLVATNVSATEKTSFATILNTSSSWQGAYWVDDVIPKAGKVVRIRGKYIDFINKTGGRVERISLTADAPRVAAAKPKTTKPGRKKSKREELMAAVDAGVKKVGDNSWEIERSLVDKVLANPTSVGRGARIVPAVKNGKPNGFKLYAIRPSSVYAKIGLMNGDTIHSVNGFDLSSPDKALEVYTKVKSASRLSVTATRRGKPVTLNYSIR